MILDFYDDDLAFLRTHFLTGGSCAIICERTFGADAVDPSDNC